MELTERKVGTPEVKSDRSFREIVENFTDPRETLREAISNALDWGASIIRITAYEDFRRADRELVIKIRDNGLGLTRERFYAFWNLADSSAGQRDQFGRKLNGRVGEKGHGTKTFWKCRQIEVESIAREDDGTDWHVLAEMREPINTLLQERLPNFEWAEEPGQERETFTEVTIRGYHTHSKEDFRHENLKDYIQWFTKFGSIELELEIEPHKGKLIELQGLGRTSSERIPFGHPFPPTSPNLRELKNRWQDTWPRYYVNRWIFQGEPVEGYPGSTIDIVFYLEGDSAKRQHNPMLARPGRTRETWHYTVTDRYGLYVCKDWIPLPASQRVNQWIAEKSEWTLYHAFVNCQDFQLTANRASIGNTDRSFLMNVRQAVEKVFETRIKASEEYRAYAEEVEDAKRRGTIERKVEDERGDLDDRYGLVAKKHQATYQPSQLLPQMLTLMEPRQEAEVLMLFTVMKTLHPDLFGFEIVDYSTSRGIDALCVLGPAHGGLQKGNLRFVEFKRALTHEFRDHTFERLAAIVCWECNLPNGAQVSDFAGRQRELRITKTGDSTTYMLLAPPDSPSNNIVVYVLREYLKERLGVTFNDPVS